MKVHCRLCWRADATLSGAIGAAEEGESMGVRARAVGEGPSVLLAEKGRGLRHKTPGTGTTEMDKK